MTSLAYFGGFALLLAFLAIVAGIAMCSHFDSAYMGTDDDIHP
jgi:hypothetical protein